MKHNINIIPAPFKTITEYEDLFVKSFNDNLSLSIIDVLKYIAKKTAIELKEINKAYTEEFSKGVEEDLAKEREEVELHPTEKQIEAGNYKKGHIKVLGFDITIENPKNSYRSGVDGDGNAWKIKMNNDYGYFTGTQGKDGDHIDVFLGDNLESERVYVVDQYVNGEFDEHKVMLGFDNRKSARDAYLSNYDKDWKGLKYITGTSVENFSKWLEIKTKKRKPFYSYKINENA